MEICKRSLVPGMSLPHVFAINTLAAYILAALISKLRRLVYLSSGMHHHAEANIDDILWKKQRWDGFPPRWVDPARPTI